MGVLAPVSAHAGPSAQPPIGMAMEVCLPSKVNTAVVMTNSTLRIVGSDNAKKNSTTNTTTKATANRGTPSLKRTRERPSSGRTWRQRS